MGNPWLVLGGIVVIALAYVLLPVAGEVFARFRGTRRVQCPETLGDTELELDARHAALMATAGRPVLRVRACALWPGRLGCGQRCLDRMRETA